jgi:hypothetical protein
MAWLLHSEMDNVTKFFLQIKWYLKETRQLPACDVRPNLCPFNPFNLCLLTKFCVILHTPNSRNL